MLDGFHRKKQWLRFTTAFVLALIALAMPASFANLTLEWPYNNHKCGIYLSAFFCHIRAKLEPVLTSAAKITVAVIFLS